MKRTDPKGGLWQSAGLVVCSFLASCSAGASRAGGGGGAEASYLGADLGLPPVAAGFVRYETSPLTVAPGQSNIWAQWVAPPLDSDADVMDVTGAQAKGGHHAILYATTDVQPVGTTRPWQDSDQLTARLVGGVGGGGGANVKLPPGVVFRIAKGNALMIQTHYLNPTAATLTGRSMIDVKLGPVDPSALVASIATNTTVKLSIAPGAPTTIETSCVVQEDLPFVMYANHMHQWGVSASTQVVGTDGTTRSIKADPVWDPNWAFDPNFSKFSLQAPSVISAGSTIQTTCTWTNTTSAAITFPTEMCVFFGFFLGDSDVNCVGGQWMATAPSAVDAGGSG